MPTTTEVFSNLCVNEASCSDQLYAGGSTALSVSLLCEKAQNVLSELSKVVQVIVQVLIDTPHIHLGVDVDEDITEAHHCPSVWAKAAGKMPASRSSSMAS
jgi:hypothetical protein